MATVNYSWTLPTVGASVNTWGTLLNTIIDDIDAKMVSKTGTQTLTNKTLAAPTFTGGITVSSGGASITGDTSVTGTLGVTGDFSASGSGGIRNTYTSAAYSFGPSSTEQIYRSGNTLRFYINSADVATLSSTGLSVTGNSSATGTIYSSARGTSAGFQLPDWLVYNTSSGNALAFNNGSDRMILDASGNLLVGTTSQPAGVGSSRLGVVSSASDYAIAANNSNASPYGFYLRYTGAAPNGNSNPFFYFQDTGGARAYMQSNGGLANYSANDSNLSDIRTKKDFVPAKSYYERWTDIEFVTFLYKDQTDTERNLGVTAQQLESVFPELIDNSGFGETPEDGIPLKAVYQTDFQYATARALQEAIEQIEILKAKVAALEARA